ncbi:hypothetical protein PsorP6_015169 [Peronosclerospora sorghi]|uniref:Uncharacterized protein n=1 Tax=Peronosclerospora sorghi TaxID=230839 RepID=A0ACC0VTR2_9STRA|nr:hypothetical protein PsorP6_015169 [Peronosclerospora sorghi]
MNTSSFSEDGKSIRDLVGKSHGIVDERATFDVRAHQIARETDGLDHADRVAHVQDTREWIDPQGRVRGKIVGKCEQ